MKQNLTSQYVYSIHWCGLLYPSWYFANSALHAPVPCVSLENGPAYKYRSPLYLLAIKLVEKLSINSLGLSVWQRLWSLASVALSGLHHGAGCDHSTDLPRASLQRTSRREEKNADISRIPIPSVRRELEPTQPSECRYFGRFCGFP